LVVQNQRNGIINSPPPIVSRVFQELSRGIVNVQNAKKITEIPFPFPYAQIMTLMILLQWCVTPIIVGTLLKTWYMAGALSLITTFFQWALLYIAVEIEDPFGGDANDLPLVEMQQDMNRSLWMLLDPQALQPPTFNWAKDEYLEFKVDLVDFLREAPKQAKTFQSQSITKVQPVDEGVENAVEKVIVVPRSVPEGGAVQASEQLQVTVVGCKGLRSADSALMGGSSYLSDPYCICKVANKRTSELSEFRTPVVKNTETPVWNHTASLSDYTDGDVLSFKVLDKDRLGNDDSLGEATLEISKLQQSGGFDGELKLMEAGKGYHPTLRVRVKVMAENISGPKALNDHRSGLGQSDLSAVVPCG
jgi:hypothetical protein